MVFNLAPSIVCVSVRRVCRARAYFKSTMANIESQKKRILRSERERDENRYYTSAIKTYFRRLEAAVTTGDSEVAGTELRALTSKIDKAVKSGALHRNTGSRKKARANRLLQSIAS